MSWLDSVLATPLFGLRLKPKFRTAMCYNSLLADFLDELLESGTVNIGSLQPVGLQVTLPQSGHQIRFDTMNIVAEFRYQLQGEVSPGELPAVKDMHVRPCSEVVGELVDLVAHASDCLAEQGHPLQCNRFGIVVRAWLADKSVPPGLEKLKTKLRGEWNRPVLKMDSTVMLRLSDSDEWSDQCHHKLAFDETEQPGQLALMLDWQRILKQPLELGVGEAGRFLVDSVDAGLQYFESVAEGGFDDA